MTQIQTEDHTKRQATQHDCLSSLLGDAATSSEKVCGEEKKYFYWAD
jgi:hypothetical protein